MTNYQLPTTKLIVLVGIPGSGKSSLAQEMIEKDRGHLLISTDAIRGKLFGDEAIQGSWLLIWQELERQLQQAVEAIASGQATTAIYDATNAVCEHRRFAIARIRQIGFTDLTGLWLDTPIWLSLARNRRRSRQVPDEVILRMYRSLRDAPPSCEDGLDRLVRYIPGKVTGEIAIAQARKNRTRPNLHL
jgi:predicted kinase